MASQLMFVEGAAHTKNTSPRATGRPKHARTDSDKVAFDATKSQTQRVTRTLAGSCITEVQETATAWLSSNIGCSRKNATTCAEVSTSPTRSPPAFPKTQPTHDTQTHLAAWRNQAPWHGHGWTEGVQRMGRRTAAAIHTTLSTTCFVRPRAVRRRITDMGHAGYDHGTCPDA